jgi:hypothetical protein
MKKPTDAERRSVSRASVFHWPVIVGTVVAVALSVGLVTRRLAFADLARPFALMGQTFYEDMHYLLPALIGVLILWYEGRLRLDFEKQKFREEQRRADQRLELMEREALSLRGVGALLAKNVADLLVQDTSWASEGLERAKLGPHAKTLFGERIGHFLDEKQHLADKFVPHLIRRCRSFVAVGKDVKLLVDSGTTLYPVLSLLGRAAVSAHESQENWVDRVEIITNNLPGMEALMDCGRSNPNNRYSPLAISCQLLPGAPLPVYSALTGEKANAAIRQLKEECDPSSTVFIALITGNWIRLRRTSPVCPVPLARGAGHKEFKEALINASDEVYVIGSLGKVFFQFSLDKVNEALGFSRDNPSSDKKPYEEVAISNEKARVVKLVSTSREPDRVLYPLSNKVAGVIDSYDLASTGDADEEVAGQPSDFLFPFDHLPHNWYLEIEAEFPHLSTRSDEFREKYFFVHRVQPAGRKAAQ